MAELERIFLTYSADKLEQYSSRIEDCLTRLTAEQIWIRGSDNQNALGNIVLHLCGNIRQWIGFGVAAEPDIRQRDAEFAARGGVTPGELSQLLQTAVEAATRLIRNLPVSTLGEITAIQTYRITKFEAIYHVVEHFSGHTGQIIFATKLLTGEDTGYYRHLSPSVIEPIKEIDRVP